MSLYLAVFDGADELFGVEIGPYSAFEAFRSAVRDELEGGIAGRRFPALMLHSDADGEWPLDACPRLGEELVAIAAGFGEPAAGRFRDVDGEPLLERLFVLVSVAIERGKPIVLQ